MLFPKWWVVFSYGETSIVLKSLYMNNANFPLSYCSYFKSWKKFLPPYNNSYYQNVSYQLRHFTFIYNLCIKGDSQNKYFHF